MEKKFEWFEYFDVDYLNSPNGWLEARISNRFRDGFEIYRDEKRLSWCGIKNYNYDTSKNITKLSGGIT